MRLLHSIPTRRELVREAARAPSATQIKEAQREQLAHHWTTCPLSHKPLQRPVVSDAVGNLYNKDAILKFLLQIDSHDTGGEGVISSRADCEEILQGRVKSLRDVVELKFELDIDNVTPGESNGAGPNGTARKRSVGGATEREKWICPVTAKELGPQTKAVYVVPCGHVFAEEAIREMKAKECLQCNEPYTEDNIIPILPVREEEKARLIARVRKLAEQGLTHSLKKAPSSKKRKKHESSADNSATTKTSTSGIKNSATAALTAKVLEEENQRKKHRSENLETLFHKDRDRHEVKAHSTDFMTRGYTLATGAKK